MPWPTVAELGVYLNQDLSAQTATAQQALDGAKAVIVKYVQTDFEEVAGEVVALSGSGSAWLVLPSWPVASVTSLSIAGQPLPVEAWWLDEKAGLVLRRHGTWPAGIANIAVTYSHGGVVPPNVELVALRLAARIMENPQDKTGESYEGTSFSWGSPRLLTPDEKATLARLPVVG